MTLSHSPTRSACTIDDVNLGVMEPHDMAWLPIVGESADENQGFNAVDMDGDSSGFGRQREVVKDPVARCDCRCEAGSSAIYELIHDPMQEFFSGDDR